jgi:hypothetical protein
MEAVTANGFGRSPRGRAGCAVIGLRFVSFRDGARRSVGSASRRPGLSMIAVAQGELVAPAKWD